MNEQLDALQQAQKARADYMASESADNPIDLEELNRLVKAEYDAAAYVAGREPTQPAEQRDPHKTTFDLEDVTGNPGHRGVTPYAPVGVNPAGFSGSINEPEPMPPGYEPDAPVVPDESEQPPPFPPVQEPTV